MMEKASKAKSSEKRTVDQDSQVQQRCKIEHPEDERDVQAGVAEVRSKGNADKMSKAGTKEEIRKDVPFSKDIYQPETKMRYKLSSVEHKFLDKEEKENESVALESLTPELVKNISPPGSKLCGVDELKLELRSRGLPVSGTKKELVDRLREDDNKDEENYGHKERCDTAKGVIPA
ncbi:hypothetical protein EMCRGX_G024509 [Ephydatia muelleri]